MKNPEIKTCECGKTFESQWPSLNPNGPLFSHLTATRAKYPETCPDCNAARLREQEAREAEELQQERLKRWERDSLPYFRNPQDNLNKCKKEFVDASNGWDPKKDGKGIIFMGTVGTGKTTCAWNALRLAALRGTYFEAIESSEFSQKVAALYARDCAEAYDWLQQLVKVEVLLIDDLGKGKLTERVEEALFSVVNGRMMHLKPMIITSNHNRESFLKQWSSERGEAILRRIKETCTVIS